MDSFQDLFKQKNIGQLVLAILFIIYLIMGYQTPAPIAKFVDTTYGIVVVVLIALLIFACTNPILGVLALLVAYTLIKQSKYVTNEYVINNHMPTEQKKYAKMVEQNKFPYTLEQEVVKTMAPINKYESVNSNNYNFHPILDNLHNAAAVGDNGSLKE
jgi:hypothetical protein